MKKRYTALLMGTGIWLHSLAYGTSLKLQDEPDTAYIASDGLQQEIAQAIHQFEQTSLGHWSYRVSRYENEEGDISSSIELFDPTKESGKQWTLLQIDNTTPTDKQLRKFTRNKLAHSQDDSQHSITVKLRDIIQIESLQLLSEERGELTASFDVHLSQLGEETSEKLKGSLTFNKKQQFIQAIEITNTEPFSPVFSADIKALRLTFHFIKIGNAILPEQQALSMQGTFAFFTDIDEVSTDTYSDYRYTGK